MSSSSSAFLLLHAAQALPIKAQLFASDPFGTNLLPTTCSTVSGISFSEMPQYRHVLLSRRTALLGGNSCMNADIDYTCSTLIILPTVQIRTTILCIGLPY